MEGIDKREYQISMTFVRGFQLGILLAFEKTKQKNNCKLPCHIEILNLVENENVECQLTNTNLLIILPIFSGGSKPIPGKLNYTVRQSFKITGVAV